MSPLLEHAYTEADSKVAWFLWGMIAGVAIVGGFVIVFI